jgi:hypothetical protein
MKRGRFIKHKRNKKKKQRELAVGDDMMEIRLDAGK